MKKSGKIIRKLLFKVLSFKQYLLLLSKGYFIAYKSGILRFAPQYNYHYFIKKMINKDDTIIDIGANMGYLSALFCKWVGPKGKVYSVEPVKDMLEILRINLKKKKNITILPYALGEEEKQIFLGNSTYSDSGFIATGRHFVLGEVDKKKQDLVTFPAEMKKGSILFKNIEKIDFIKCDIEGYERVVLTEMKDIIEKHKPIMMIETSGENRTFLIDFLTGLGYTTYILEKGKLNKSNHLQSAKDIIAIPDFKLNMYSYLMNN